MKVESRKIEKDKLHECMGEELRSRMELIRAYQDMKDVESLWSTLSKCNEDAWLEYFEVTKEMTKTK